MPQWQKCNADDINKSDKFYIITAVSDNRQPMKSKRLWILGFSATSIKLWRISAFLPSHLTRPLRKQKVMVCDWWILIRFVCFCLSRFVAFELQCSVACFWKAQYLTCSCKFFIFFILKHGKFRFPRWNCSYTYKIFFLAGWKWTSTFPPTFTFAASARLYCRLYLILRLWFEWCRRKI